MEIGLVYNEFTEKIEISWSDHFSILHFIVALIRFDKNSPNQLLRLNIIKLQ